MTRIEENVSKAGHELKEWQKEGYIQKEALKSMFILNLNKKLNWKQHYEKARYEFRSQVGSTTFKPLAFRSAER